MKPTLRMLALGAVLAPLTASTALAETVTVNFVLTNDIDRMAEEDGRGGFARLAAVVAAERAKGPTIFVHAGDTISPSLLSGIDKGAHIIDILNHMGVDVFAPGNHEFDFGPEVFRARIGEATFPVVSSNIKEPDSSQPANTVERRIVEIEGVKIGFYGLTTEDTYAVSSPGEMKIAPAVDAAAAQSAALKEEGADLIVAVTHTPLDDEMQMVRDNSADIILAGHDEHLLTFYNGRTVLAESGSQAEYVVVVETTIDKQEEDGAVSVSWTPSFRIVDTATVEPDAEIAALIKSYTDRLDTELGVAIGTTGTPLDSRRASVRSQETAIGNLIADAMRAAVDAEVALTNGGGIRADRQYEAGATLTRADILSELPFGNKTVKLELTGADIRNALENGFSQVEQTAGRFPQISGMTVEADFGRQVGAGVVSVKVGDQELDTGKTYTLATNDFMAAGGDGYTAFIDAEQLISGADANLMATQVIDYIAAAGTVAPEVEGRIVTR